MRITQHPSNNGVLSAPDGMSHEQCKAAPITRVYFTESEDHAVRTYWQPTEAERAAIAAGAMVCVQVLGRSMPPMWVCAEGHEDDPAAGS